MIHIKIIIYLILFFLIYGYSFEKLGNTLYRLNANNQMVYSIKPLFTEGIIGPIRTLYLLFRYNGYTSGLSYFTIMITRLWSPYAVLLVLYIFNKKFP